MERAEPFTPAILKVLFQVDDGLVALLTTAF